MADGYVYLKNLNGGLMQNPYTGHAQVFRVQERDPKLGVLVYDPFRHKTIWIDPRDVVERETER